MTDMIKPYFSVRYKRKRYRLDLTLRNGQRIRRSFDTTGVIVCLEYGNFTTL